MLVDVVIRAGEANPKDVVLYEPLTPSIAFIITQDSNILMLASSTEAMGGGGEPSLPSAFVKVWNGSSWVVKGLAVYR